jgi:hypothetical protein
VGDTACLPRSFGEQAEAGARTQLACTGSLKRRMLMTHTSTQMTAITCAAQATQPPFSADLLHRACFMCAAR